MPGKHYIIRGGIEGRERLRILSRVMQPTTHHALRRAGIRQGMSCLDIGCGGGDLAFDMGCMVGPTGTVVGTDIDHKKLEPARQEAAEQGLGNAEFQLADITETDPEGQFDLIHARFVLAHLANPAQPWPECVVRCEPVESSCWKTIFLPAGERRFLALRRTLHGDRSAEGR